MREWADLSESLSGFDLPIRMPDVAVSAMWPPPPGRLPGAGLATEHCYDGVPGGDATKLMRPAADLASITAARVVSSRRGLATYDWSILAGRIAIW